MQTPTTQADPSQDARRCIKRLRSRFERWELTHLRELAASLHEQLQDAEQRTTDAEQSAAYADRRADTFMDMNNEMSADLERCGKRLGLTVQGDLVLLPRTPQRLICDDFGNLVEVAA